VTKLRGRLSFPLDNLLPHNRIRIQLGDNTIEPYRESGFW
jgi:hypothetical protein